MKQSDLGIEDLLYQHTCSWDTHCPLVDCCVLLLYSCWYSGVSANMMYLYGQRKKRLEKEKTS